MREEWTYSGHLLECWLNGVERNEMCLESINCPSDVIASSQTWFLDYINDVTTRSDPYKVTSPPVYANDQNILESCCCLATLREQPGSVEFEFGEFEEMETNERRPCPYCGKEENTTTTITPELQSCESERINDLWDDSTWKWMKRGIG
ncbi:uncharacterized protein LOC102803023 [Saccoglossus kowalevskii]